MRAALIGGAAALALIPAAGVAADVPPPAPDPHVVAAEIALKRLTLPQRAGQVVMTSVPGSTLRDGDVRTLRRVQPGGVILFASNYRNDPQVRRLNRLVQDTARRDGRPGALISIDQEGGLVKRISKIAPTRSHPQLGATNRPAQTRAQGRATARALTARGINMNLAPVADLDLGPRHVMKQRSFGRVPARVSRHVAAFVEGLEQGNVAASIKHFPGFGGASVNSDDAYAVITRTRGQLLGSDLQPFRAGIRAGAGSVMMSHGVYRNLDARRPASTNPAAYRLLRGRLGYEGVAITDSLHATGFAAASRGGVIAGCASTLRAGADIVLLTGSLRDASQCRSRIIADVRAKRISRKRLDEAALRVLVLKSKLGLLPASK
ncbi:MAG: glycoside hydrolase family 3 N-terminal domain-containing protein [Gaiellales bacterium]